MNSSAKVCRHGFILQLYRGKLFVAGINSEWAADEAYQKNLVSLEHVAQHLKAVGEDRNTNKSLSTYIRREAGTMTVQ